MEEWMLYFGLAICIFIVLLVIKFVRGDGMGSGPSEPDRVDNRRPQQAPRGQVNRRAAGVRNRRLARRIDDSDSDEAPQRTDEEPAEGQIVDEEGLLNDPKLGAKKKAKLEAKLEKKAQREAEERLRKEKKDEETKAYEERKKLEEKEAEEEKQKLEEEKRLRQEQAQRELEEYQKLKEAFTVEDEGCEVAESEEEQNLLEQFITHIRKKKVVLFEELASEFGLKVPDTIERITTLVKEGRLTGVMDDRGKFIYISEAELKKFATFVKQRGRVSITELVENSSSLVNLLQEST